MRPLAPILVLFALAACDDSTSAPARTIEVVNESGEAATFRLIERLPGGAWADTAYVNAVAIGARSCLDLPAGRWAAEVGFTPSGIADTTTLDVPPLEAATFTLASGPAVAVIVGNTC